MKFLNKAKLSIPESKITHYLLSYSHPEGMHKAFFFLRFGFVPSEWKILSNALIQHANENSIFQKTKTPFGLKYLIKGRIRTPDGRNPKINSVWFKENKEEIIKFVTAYPEKQ